MPKDRIEKVLNARGEYIGYVLQRQANMISIKATENYKGYVYNLKINAKRNGFDYVFPFNLDGYTTEKNKVIMTSYDYSLSNFHGIMFWGRESVAVPIFVHMSDGMNGNRIYYCLNDFDNYMFPLTTIETRKTTNSWDTDGAQIVNDGIKIGQGFVKPQGRDELIRMGYTHMYQRNVNDFHKWDTGWACSYQSIGSTQIDQMDFPLRIQKNGKIYHFPA